MAGLPPEIEGLSPEAVYGLAVLAKKLGGKGAKTRKEFTKLVQQVDPTYKPALSEDEVLEQVNDRFEEEENKRKSRDMQKQLEAEKAELLTRYEEGQLKEIEKLMEQRGIANYKDAAIIYASELPAPEPTSKALETRSWTIPKMDPMSNPIAARRQKLHEVIHDLRSRKSA